LSAQHAAIDGFFNGKGQKPFDETDGSRFGLIRSEAIMV